MRGPSRCSETCRGQAQRPRLQRSTQVPASRRLGQLSRLGWLLKPGWPGSSRGEQPCHGRRRSGSTGTHTKPAGSDAQAARPQAGCRPAGDLPACTASCCTGGQARRLQQALCAGPQPSTPAGDWEAESSAAYGAIRPALCQAGQDAGALELQSSRPGTSAAAAAAGCWSTAPGSSATSAAAEGPCAALTLACPAAAWLPAAALQRCALLLCSVPVKCTPSSVADAGAVAAALRGQEAGIIARCLQPTSRVPQLQSLLQPTCQARRSASRQFMHGC